MRRPPSLRRQFVTLLATVLLAAGCTGSDAPEDRASPSPPTTAAEPEVLADGTLLPDPMPAEGTPGERAAAIADAIAAGGDVDAAVVAGILGSGFSIRDVNAGNEVVLAPTGPDQGIAVQAGIAVAMAREVEDGYSVALTDLAELVAAELSPDLGMDARTLAPLLLDGVRAHAQPGAPLEAWARLIVELGLRGPDGGVELLDPDLAPKDVHLDAVQANLLMVRLAADLFVLASEQGAVPEDAEEVLTLPTAGGGAAGSFLGAGRSALAAAPPCALDTVGSLIVQGVSRVLSTGFGAVVNQMIKNAGGVVLDPLSEADKIAKFKTVLKAAGVALSFLRYVATFMMFEAELELIGGEPLTRTKTKRAGENRELRITAKFDVGKSAYLNCLRLVLAQMGLSFSVPTEGPIRGAPVEWQLLQGGGVDGFLFFFPWPRGPGTGNPVRTETRDTGVSSTGVQGRPQKGEIPEDAKPVSRTAVVRAAVIVKPREAWADLVSTAIGNYAPGPGQIVSIPAELLLRIGALGDGLTFEVVDWVDEWLFDLVVDVHTTRPASDLVYRWTGRYEVDAQGAIVGGGTGTIDGRAYECLYDEATYPINASVTGTFSFDLGGRRRGGRFDFEVKGRDAEAKYHGSVGKCQPIRRLAELGLAQIAYLADGMPLVVAASEGAKKRSEFKDEQGTFVATLTVRRA